MYLLVSSSVGFVPLELGQCPQYNTIRLLQYNTIQYNKIIVELAHALKVKIFRDEGQDQKHSLRSKREKIRLGQTENTNV